MSPIIKAVLVALLGISVYFYFNAWAPKKLSAVVQTKSGKVQGVISVSRSGRNFFGYYGIPYAKPPVGDLRFESPQPVEKWSGIRPAQEFGADCLQLELTTVEIMGSEDCLLLNVYTPQIEADKALAVMVWIHGGMYHVGTGAMYGPEYFMDEDVILVTLNYRLGALGFLSTGDAVVRGNMGLKDQNFALRWIKDNIANFGGNPTKITIFGESAGAASVHFQILSSQSKGLFQRAISQSGVGTSLWSARRHPKAQLQAKRFGEIMKCPTGNSKEMVDCMKAASPETIINAHRGVEDPLRDPMVVFTPVVEAVNDEEAFLTEDPMTILKKGKANKVPWIAGLNSEDGLFVTIPFIAGSLFPKVKSEWEDLLPKLIWYTGPPMPEKFEEITKFYIGSKDNVDSEDQFGNLTNLLTDNIFSLGLHEAARLQAKHSPVYLYYYSYQGSFFSLANLLMALKGTFPPKLEILYFFVKRWIGQNLGIEPHHYGTCHFDEVPMLFAFPVGQIGTKYKDYEMSRNLVKLWVDFANDDKSMKFNGKTWSSVDPGATAPLQYFRLDGRQSGMIDEPFEDRVKFLKALNLTNMRT